MEQNHDPYLYLFKQGTWALLGLLLVPIVMRIDYRNYRQPAFIWTVRRDRRRRPGGGAVRPARERRQPLARHRSARHPALGAGEDCRHLLHRGAARTADGSHRRDSVTRCCRSASSSAALVALILAEPDLGTAVSVVMIAAVMVFAAGLSYTLHRRVVPGRSAGVLPAGDDLAVPPAPDAVLPQSLGRSARRRLPDDPVDDRGRHRRGVRPRPDGRRAEAVLPARAAQRFHLLGDCRGARADRRDGRARLLLRDHLARPADGDAGAGPVRRLPGDRADDDGRLPGVLQHQRGSRPGADRRAFRCRSSAPAARRCSSI